MSIVVEFCAHALVNAPQVAKDAAKCAAVLLFAAIAVQLAQHNLNQFKVKPPKL